MVTVTRMYGGGGEFTALLSRAIGDSVPGLDEREAS